MRMSTVKAQKNTYNLFTEIIIIVFEFAQIAITLDTDDYITRALWDGILFVTCSWRHKHA